MRKISFLIFATFVFSSILFTQTIIENPEKPLSKNAGRVLKLQEVLRITDESGDFYFKYPRDFMVAYDGSIFFRDDEQILKFSPEGNFISNFFKKGQGPGEISGWNYPFVLYSPHLLCSN